MPTNNGSIIIVEEGLVFFETPHDPISFRQKLYANKAFAAEWLAMLDVDLLRSLTPHFIDLDTTISMLPTDEVKLNFCKKIGAEWIALKIDNSSNKFISLLSNFQDQKYLMSFCKLLGSELFTRLLAHGIPLLKFLILLKSPAHREIYFNGICRQNPEKVIANGGQLYNLLALLPVTSREGIIKRCPFSLQEDLGLYLSTLRHREKCKFINDNVYIANLEQPHILLHKRILDMIEIYSQHEERGKHLWRLTALEAEAKIAIDQAYQNRLRNPDLAHEYNNHTAEFIIRRMESTFQDLIRRRESLFRPEAGVSRVNDLLNRDVTHFHCTRMMAVTLHQAYVLFGDLLKKTPARLALKKQVAEIENLDSYQFSTMKAPTKKKVAPSDMEMAEIMPEKRRLGYS